MSKRILIVDDEVAISWALKMALTEEGYFVSVKNRAEEGLAEFKKAVFDLVISDLRMPDMDGIEMLTEIRKINTHVKFIVMTAFPSLETALDAIKLKVEHYISKPFKVEEVKRIISNIDFVIDRTTPVSQIVIANLSEAKIPCVPVPKSTLDILYLNKMKESQFEKRLIFDAEIENIYKCKDLLVDDLKAYLDSSQLELLITIMLELLINGVKFAVTRIDSSDFKKIELFYKLTKDNCMIEVTYLKQLFRVDEASFIAVEKTYTEILKLRQVGLFMVKVLSDSFKVKIIKDDTKVFVSKNISLKQSV